MKSLYHYFLVPFMLISIFSYGQEKKMEEEKKETKKLKHEVRIIMENFLERQDAVVNAQIWNSSNFSNTGTYEFYNNKFKYGLGYNLNFKKFGIRTKGFYSTYNEIFFDTWGQENFTKSELLRISLGLNYQKHLEKITLFVGIDVSYFKIDLEQFQPSLNSSVTPDISQLTNYTGTGVEPLVGFKYFLSKNFSLGSEIRFIRDSFQGNTLITYNNSFNFGLTNNETKFDGSHTKLGPKGSISLNVHF